MAESLVELTDLQQPISVGNAPFELKVTKGSASIGPASGDEEVGTAVVTLQPETTCTISGWIGVTPHTGYRLRTHHRKSSEVDTKVELVLGAVESVRETQRDAFERHDVRLDSAWNDALLVEWKIGHTGDQAATLALGPIRLETTGTPATPQSLELILDRPTIEATPYLYGQFIEHLGRCIQGGIWAEMLEDRKFFWQPGTEPSPWRLEPAQAATKNRLPGIRLSGTVFQHNVTLQADHAYVVRVVLSGPPGAQIQLRVGDWQENVTLSGSALLRHEFSFTSGQSTTDAVFSLTANDGIQLVAASLMPADHVEGFRADVLDLLRQLDSPIYRWPGGNFVSGYDWRDGIGDRDFRPTRKNPAWMGIESNDMGTLEFLRFCELINTEPLIVVNTGFGDSHSAMEWVEYVNGSPDTRLGRLRTEHGRSDPGNVKWWGIGNEMYGPWQLGHMSIDHYVIKHRDFVDKMRAVDPAIKTVAVGELGFGEWSRRMLTDCADQMDHLSEHFYCGEKPGLMTHARQVTDAVRSKVNAHRGFRQTIPSLQGKDIRIALDEWNYWYGEHIFGELGTRYFWKDGVGIAMGIHEMLRNADLFAMANYAQTVNVIGAIKTTDTAAAFETTGLVLQMYRKKFGLHVVPLEGDFRPLDVVAAWTHDRRTLTLGVINATKATQRLPLSPMTPSPQSVVELNRIAADPDVYNDPGTPPNVSIETQYGIVLSGFYDAPPSSVTILTFRRSGQ